jgi:DNA-binding MarR family transcriptional regulator|tara:strand:+ start:877 stop:1257 length:381 start_codon:yes stop_codon:yes gene_type:complete
MMADKKIVRLFEKYSKHKEMFDTLKKNSITISQFYLMLILALRGDEWISMQDLVFHLQKTAKVGQSSVSRAIQTLGAEGRIVHTPSGKITRSVAHDFLESKINEKDGRLLSFRLNKRGVALINKVT